MAQQNTLWLTNGKKLTIGDYKIQDDHNGDSVMVFTSDKGKEKERYLDEVFSVIDNNGAERVIYYSNATIGEILTVDQMRSFVNGQYDGKQTKISPLISITAAAAGFGGAFIPNPSIKSGSTSIDIPVGILIPTAHALISGGFSTPDKVLQKNFPNRIDDKYYVMGVDHSLQKKRVKHSLIAGLAGFVAGMIVVVSVN